MILKDRARRILIQVTDCDEEKAEKLLKETEFSLKPAILMALSGFSLVEATTCLERSDGYLRKALDM